MPECSRNSWGAPDEADLSFNFLKGPGETYDQDLLLSELAAESDLTTFDFTLRAYLSSHRDPPGAEAIAGRPVDLRPAEHPRRDGDERYPDGDRDRRDDRGYPPRYPEYDDHGNLIRPYEDDYDRRDYPRDLGFDPNDPEIRHAEQLGKMKDEQIANL